MPPLASTAISQATSFLNQQFSRGSDAPYDPQFQRLIRQHLLDLVGDIPSLTLKREQYTDNYGSSSRLVVAEGTVPMYYQNVKYNIPVALWLPERYPMAPPLMYVVPTPDMVIKPRHTFVDPSGLVASPYLSNWAYPDSNLRELAQDASIMFSSDPPLYSKPPGWTPPAARPGQPPGGAGGPPQPSAGPGGPLGGPGRPPYPGPPPPGGMQPPGGMYGQPGSPPHMHNPIHYPFGTASSYPSQSGNSFTSQSGSSFTSQPSNPPYPGANPYPPMPSAGSGFGTAGSGFNTAGSGPGMSGAGSGGSGGGGGGYTPWGYNPAAVGPMEAGPMGASPYGQPQPSQYGSMPASPPKPGKQQQLQSSAAEETRRELQGAFRATALAALSRRLAASVAAASAGAAGEVEKLGDAQAELARREALLQQEVAALQSERVTLDKAAQELGGAAAQLDSWLANNERAVAAVAGDGQGGSSAVGQPDPDSAIVAADSLSQQAMEVQAQDLALEDALYALDKALNAGLVQPDAYLKQVRAVCRQQFMARALGNKIAAKQNEERRRRAAQPAPAGTYGPAPVAGPQGGVPMPIGDSWYSTGILPNPLAPMAAQR